MRKFLTLTITLFFVLAQLHSAGAVVSTSTDAPKICVYNLVQGQNLGILKLLTLKSGQSFMIRTSTGLMKWYPTTTPIAPINPAPAPALTPTPQPVTNATALQTEMLGYINAERAKANVGPLILNQALCNGAALKSQDMAVNGYFDHTSPTYGSPFDMMKSLGITYHMAGENIALNISVKGAHDALMNSAGHKANILNSGFKAVGLGFYQKGSSLYVTQWFTD
ncbi:MAG TPA: CAP domain-containing protein [Syntrophomonadaceae bacterium]|nr:CAP domain-containing protein [Syntrophomonadaceae bacterium]